MIPKYSYGDGDENDWSIQYRAEGEEGDGYGDGDKYYSDWHGDGYGDGFGSSNGEEYGDSDGNGWGDGDRYGEGDGEGDGSEESDWIKTEYDWVIQNEKIVWKDLEERKWNDYVERL